MAAQALWERRTAGSTPAHSPSFGLHTSNFAFGNEVRNSLRGPRLTVVNLSLSKTVDFTERFHLELRADFVNALNHPSFNIPDQSLGTSIFRSDQRFHTRQWRFG